MEKSNFFASLSEDTTLSNRQMAHIKGGILCGAKVLVGDTYRLYCNISEEKAISLASEGGGNWCCEMCGSNGGYYSWC